MRLGDGDGDADAGEHAVHDRGTHGEGAARHAQTAEPQLDESGEDGDGAGDAPAVLVDEIGGDDREPRRRSAHLERGAAEPSGDEPAHRRGDQAGLEGAPVASAMPRDRGRAMRKTATAAERSAPATRKRGPRPCGGLCGGGLVRCAPIRWRRRERRLTWTPVSFGSARSRDSGGPLRRSGRGRGARPQNGGINGGTNTGTNTERNRERKATLGKQIVIESKGPA